MSPLVARVFSVLTREAREVRGAVRSTPRRVVIGEGVLCTLVLALGFIPLPTSLALPSHVAVAAAGSACWAALLVPARRRWPVATLLATAPVFASPNIWALATLPVMTFSAARRITPARRLWFTVLVTAGVDLLLMGVAERNLRTGFGEILAGYALSAGFLLLLPVAAGALVGQRQPLVRILRERNEYLERARMLTEEKARMTERAHIATEMHDMLGHRLSLISMHAGALEVTTTQDAPRLSGQAELLRTTAATALTDLREILGVLRDPGHDHASEISGTRSDITDLVTESQNAGINVELVWSGADIEDVDPRTRHAVHRVVREGLTNVHKHASTAPTTVEVTSEVDRIGVSVISGPSPGLRRRLPGTQNGLVGLEERISLLRGAFTAGPTVEGGFQVVADLPPNPAVPASSGPRPLPDGHEPAEPLDAEVLTLPRALGAGCLGLLAVVPVATGVAMLIIMLVLE